MILVDQIPMPMPFSKVCFLPFLYCLSAILLLAHFCTAMNAPSFISWLNERRGQGSICGVGLTCLPCFDARNVKAFHTNPLCSLFKRDGTGSGIQLLFRKL